MSGPGVSIHHERGGSRDQISPSLVVTPPQKTVILTDSKAALQSLTSNTPDQPIHQLLKDLQLLPHECTVVLQWIAAHCGIPGNERADRLAKTGSKQLQPTSTSTYQEAKTLLRNRQKCQWKRATGDYNPSTDPVNRLARHEQTTIFRLRTGHCGLRAHLMRIGIMDSALCDCKEAEQTVHHIHRTVPSGGNRDTSYGRNHQQAVGNGGGIAPHHPVPGNMWTEGLSTADGPQKKSHQ